MNPLNDLMIDGDVSEITRIRVAGILISDERILLESLLHEDVWGIPGGGLESSETIQAGCQREYREEIGLEIVCERVLFVTENIWQESATKKDDIGLRIREYAFYFQVSPKHPFIETYPSFASIEGHLKFDWFPLGQLPQLEFVPQFMMDPLQKLQPNVINLPPQIIFHTELG